MHTTFLGEEEVEAYVRDLVERLEAAEDIPKIWCAIGHSGDELVAKILKTIRNPERFKCIRADYDRESRQVTLEGNDSLDDCRGQHVFVLDSAIHSGNTMAAIVQNVVAAGAASVTTYTLVLKRGTRFVPSLWAIMIDDHDRAYFLLNAMPNNRLGKMKNCMHLRKLSESDLQKPPIKIPTVPSIARATWADRYYDMINHQDTRWTYVLEAGGDICGFITFELRDSRRLIVEEVAVDDRHMGKGYGKALMRWAETCARQSNAGLLRLWAIEDRLGFYRDLQYQEVPGKTMDLDEEKYCLMHKPILSHVPLATEV